MRETALAFNDILAITFIRERRGAEGETIEDIVGVGEILSAFASKMPPGFPRALGNEYLYGVHALAENNPFLIASVRSYEDAFGNLYEWGPRAMLSDLAPLLGITRFPPPEVLDFTDVLIKNRDVRVVYDAELAPILYYSFVNQNTLGIATDETTFDEILNRLATPRRTLR